MNYHLLDDRSLVEALRGPREELANDPRELSKKNDAELAFAELYSRYGQRTYAFLLRMTGETAASQDLLQDTFVKFHHAAVHDLVITNPGGFILMIARNLSLNWRRDEAITLGSSRLQQMTGVAFEDLNVLAEDYRHEQDDLLRLITAALELLDLPHREAFVLKFYQGYSYEEMAGLTGETLPTLKNRVWRAKEKIKKALKPYILDSMTP